MKIRQARKICARVERKYERALEKFRGHVPASLLWLLSTRIYRGSTHVKATLKCGGILY